MTNTAPPTLMARLARWGAQAGLAIGVVMAGLFGYHYLVATKPVIKKRPPRETVWPVQAIRLHYTTIQPTLRLFGETLPGRKIELRAHVAGEVIETGPDFKDGGRVRAGALLVKIDPFVYQGALEEASASLAEARARLKEIRARIALEQDSLKYALEQLRLARTDLNRARKLVTQKTVSRKLVDDRQLIFSQRQQALQQHRNNITIEKARAAQQQAVIKRLKWRREQAERNLAYTIIKAPFDADITGVTARTGRLININDTLATLYDLHQIDVRFTLTNRQYGHLIAAPGGLLNRPVEILWHVGDQPLRFKARIERINPQINAETGGVELFARLLNPARAAAIRAGAFVEVHLPDRKYEQVARIPQAALHDNKFVYAIENARLKRVPVTIAGLDNGALLIRSKLTANSEILTSPLTLAGPGVKVRVIRTDNRPGHQRKKKPQAGPQSENRPTADSQDTQPPEANRQPLEAAKRKS